jgi:large subunit ribosomal protein L25
MLELAIKPRDSKESSENLRAAGAMPAVLYGPKESATPITIDLRTFERLFKKAGETTLVKLTGIGEDKDTLIHEVQFHPVTDKPLHADFLVLEKGKKVTLNIPLEFVGAAPAEKLGHIVTKVLHEVEIEVAPHEIPQHLEVDISTLENVGDHMTAKEIALPASAELKTDPEEILVSITAFVEEKPLETEVKLAEVGEPAKEGEAAEGATATAEEKKEEKK